MAVATMRWLCRRYLIIILSIFGFILVLSLFSDKRDNRDLAIRTYREQFPSRHLNRLKHDERFYKAKAEEAYKKFHAYNEASDIRYHYGEEVEVNPQLLRRKQTTKAPFFGFDIAMTSLYFIVDDGRYDSQQIFRCSHERLYSINGSKCVQPESYLKKPFDLTIWSLDYSSGAVEDIKFLLEPMGVKFITKSLSPNCNVYRTCAKRVPGIDSLSGLLLNEDKRRTFVEAHKSDPEFLSADAVLCIRPAALCELYLTFSKSIIINIDTRYEFGRWDLERWSEWNTNLAKISENQNNIITATSQYDVEYVRYYTGMAPFILRPYCGYIGSIYSPITWTHFLISPIRQYQNKFEKSFMQEFNYYAGLSNSSTILTNMGRNGFDQGSANMVSYPGIILIPYQVSSLRMTEIYRMNIPLFIPSLELLTNWQKDYNIVSKMSWQEIAKKFGGAITSMPGKISVPNPNDIKNKDSIGFWLNFAEFYSWPYVIRFNSINDLVLKLNEYSSTPAGQQKLLDISKQMQKYNKATKANIQTQWKEILSRVQQRKLYQAKMNTQNSS